MTHADHPATRQPELSRIDAPAPVARFHGVTLLIVDDNDVNRDIARELFEPEGAVALLADDGLQALAVLSQHAVDCVLMDIQMPLLDGISTTRRIRETPALATLPVIALTADTRDENRAACLAAGMNDFLCKPVMPTLLFAAVERVLGMAPRAAHDRWPPQAWPGARDGEVIDLGVLAGYLDGNLQRVEGVARMFVSLMTRTMHELESSLVRQDVPALKALGHRAKSSAATVGALGLMRLCEALQDLAPADTSIAEAAAILRQLPSLLAQISNRIDAAFA